METYERKAKFAGAQYASGFVACSFGRTLQHILYNEIVYVHYHTRAKTVAFKSAEFVISNPFELNDRFKNNFY